MEIEAFMEGFPRNWIWKHEWDFTVPAESPAANFVKRVRKIRFRNKRRISYSADTVLFFKMGQFYGLVH